MLDLRIKGDQPCQRNPAGRVRADDCRAPADCRAVPIRGGGEAARIEAERERDLQRIQSEAFRAAEELRGKAGAEATDVYAAAYNRDPYLYAFTRSLESYEKVMDAQTIFILGTDSEFLKDLHRPP